MLVLIFILLSICVVSYLTIKEHFFNFNKKKLGVIITSYGYNGIFLEHTIKSYLIHVPKNTIIIVYVNNCDDPITLHLPKKYSNIVFKFQQNSTYNVSKIWNNGINFCLSRSCSHIIISRDDLIFTDCIKNLIINSYNEIDVNKCFVPVVNCKQISNNQHYNNYGNNLLKTNFPIKEYLVIFNSISLKKNKINNKVGQFFNIQHKSSYNSLQDWINRFNLIGGQCFIYSNTFLYCYNRKSISKMTDKRCLYLINTGNYEGDKININNNNNEYNCDVILFTDNIQQIKYCFEQNIIPFYTFSNTFQDPQKLQRFIKTSPHLWLPYEYDISIYIDGNVMLTIQDTEILVKNFLSNYDVVCWKHPNRSNIFDEADQVVKKKLAKPNTVIKVLELMRQDGFKDDVGLTETNILIRRHKNIIPFSNKWSDFVNICRRDQISFDYLLYKFNINHKKYDFYTKPLTKFKHIFGWNRFIN